MNSKIIVIDFSIFVHRAIFAWRYNRQVPPEYTCLNMILSCLIKIGINKEDKIIMACDGKGNWRKDYETEYKANRKEYRESFEDIDWNDMWYKFNLLLEKINYSTNWHVIKLERIEADDIASVCCRYFKDKEIVLVSYDKDWELLWNYDSVKIFSQLLKINGAKGAYKVKPDTFNAYKLLSQKIEKEKTDNLINPITNEKEYENRKICVNLLELPEFVEETVKEALLDVEAIEKSYDLGCFPFRTLREKLNLIINHDGYKDKIITYEQCIINLAKKDARKQKRRNKNGRAKQG